MKLRKLLFPFLIVLLIATFGFNKVFLPDEDPIKFPVGQKYKKEWAKVDSLDKLGLPKSALEIVNKIYESASKENNPDQIIKATLHRMKYLNMVEESAFEAAINSLEDEVKKAKFPNDAMMNSMLAEMYWMYYQNNRWKFYDRSQTINFDQDDIKTWDLNKLADKSIKHYQLSLQNADSLKRTSVEVYDEVIFDYDYTKKYRPTLFDFLAHRAINFYKNSELSLTRPADKFMLKENFYLSDAETFVKENIQTSDTLALQFYGVKVLQELLKFRLLSSNSGALIYADIDRLEFMHTNSVSEIKDSLYLNTLLNIEKKYSGFPESSEISYLIALQYYQLSTKYVPSEETTEKYKYYRKMAYDICIKTIDKYPKANGTLKCKNLKSTIETHSISVTVEDVVLPNQTFAALINYQNTTKAYIRVATIDSDKLKKLQEKYYNYELIDRLLKESVVVQQYSQDLIDDKDFHNHTTEYLIDGLPIGNYVIFISNNEEFSYNNNMVAYGNFVVSGLSYLSRSLKDGSYEFYVTDRKTGEPQSGVTVYKWISKYDYVSRSYKMEKTGTYISDEKGYFNVPYDSKERNNYYYMEFIKGSDRLFSSSYFYSYYYNYGKNRYYSTTIFTDRAIYRPGQTVYFKGITLDVEDEKKEIA
ncbi:MAG: hypothetical protein ABIJ97_07605, partial [Bacteroidota bacterium]